MIDDVADVGVDWGGSDSVLLSCGCWYYYSFSLNVTLRRVRNPSLPLSR